MKNKQNARVALLDFADRQLYLGATNWAVALFEWTQWAEGVVALGLSLKEMEAQSKELGWAWQGHSSQGPTAVQWDELWAKLAVEAIHGKSVFDAVKKDHPNDYREKFERIKRDNLAIYTRLLDMGLKLGCFRPKDSPETLGRWISNGWLSLLEKHLTEWGGAWADQVEINNSEKKKVFASLLPGRKIQPTLMSVFVAQLRKEEKTNTAIQFAKKHHLPTHPDIWASWLVPMGEGKNPPERRVMVKDRDAWVKELAKTQQVNDWRHVEPQLERTLVSRGIPIPLTAWRHTVEREGLKNRVSETLSPKEKTDWAL